MKFGVQLFWPAYAVVGLLALATAAQIFAYMKTTRPISPAAKWFLALIRIAAVWVLALALLRPAIESSQTVERKGRLALLVDASRSMSIGDEVAPGTGAPLTRLQRSALVFSENASLWNEITAGAQVEAHAFSSGLSPLPAAPEDFASRVSFGVSPDGRPTALGEALRSVMRTTPPPQAVLLFSDGLSNSGIDPLSATVEAGVPIYAVSVGSSEPSLSTRDVASAGIYAPATAFKDAEVSVVGEFSATGMAGRTINVDLFADEGKIASKTVTPTAGRETLTVDFTWKARESGPARLEVRATPLSDEIVAANNSAATFIDVKEGAMTILYVEGNFRWEAKFLRKALETLRDAEVRFLIAGPSDKDKLERTLEERWDVLVIGNLSSDLLSAEARRAVVNKVTQDGKGVLFLGGPEGLGRGGYADTQLAPLCPFELSGEEKFDECIWVVEPVARALHGDIIALNTDDDARAWRVLSPLLAVNTVGRPRFGATVLLTAAPKRQNDTNGALEPCPLRSRAALFAVQEYGKGRTAAFTGEGTWQWAMGSRVAERDRDLAAEVYERFYRQALSWLSGRQETDETTVDLELASHRIPLGEKMRVSASVLDGRGGAIADAELTARVTTGDGEETYGFWPEGDRFRLEFEPVEGGDYHIEVSAVRGGEVVGEAESAFVVEAADVELATLVSRASLLAALAGSTDGVYAPADSAETVFESIAAKVTSARYLRTRRSEIWSSWAYLALVVGLLASEWILRKVAGLA